jgi:hypothetical protein
LKPERNSPCPCGSGKKYKKCCGLVKTEAREGQDIFKLNQSVAYLGEVGRRREDFCINYTKEKQAGIEEIVNELRRDIATQGKAITCSRGCAYCCSVYVFATLQECECIVYYLYRHNDDLQHFLKSYTGWRQEISKIERSYRLIERIQEKAILGWQVTQDEQGRFDTALTAFTSRNISCPFLLPDQSCSIYEVRPFVCAGVVSTYSPELCSPANPRHDTSLLCKAEIKTENEMPYFVQPKSPVVFGCLPELVHGILERGYSLLSTVQGLEHLKGKVARDPEVQMALKQANIF